MPLKKPSKTRFGRTEKPHLKREGQGGFGNHCKLGKLAPFDKKKWDKSCDKRAKKRKSAGVKVKFDKSPDMW